MALGQILGPGQQINFGTSSLGSDRVRNYLGQGRYGKKSGWHRVGSSGPDRAQRPGQTFWARAQPGTFWAMSEKFRTLPSQLGEVG